MAFTSAQQKAIDEKGKTLLVSAAAGSGKTATLKERIIRSLTDKDNPCDISRMLVVTFTRAAAAELKSRISSALTEEIVKDPANKHLRYSLMALGSADISTIDSFYLNTVRANFQLLSLPSSFRIADEEELSLLSKSIMNDLIEEYYNEYQSRGRSFADFANNFTDTKTDERLDKALFSIYEELLNIPEGFDYLDRCADGYENDAKKDFLRTDCGKIFAGKIEDTFSLDLKILEDACDLCLGDEKLFAKAYPSFKNDADVCRAVLSSIEEKDFAALGKLLASYEPIKLGVVTNNEHKDEYDYFKNYRAKIKKDFQAAKDSLHDETYISFVFEKTADILRILGRLLREFDEKYRAEKISRGICEFSDIKRYALELLVGKDGNPTELAKAISDKYDYIYIDEYQDVDPVQDLIFKAISKPGNRFMVGDIKQSIYSFRDAEPDIFAAYKKEFPPIDDADDSDTASIFMSENFRCDESIVNFSNSVFGYLFGICAESIGYTKADDLVFSKALPYQGYVPQKVQLTLVEKDSAVKSEDVQSDEESDGNGDADDGSAEEKYVANEIKRLIENKKKADGTPIRKKDIAILTRNNKSSLGFSKALSSLGIASSVCENEMFFENPDVLMVLCILTAIDNPQKDIFLAGTLRSPFFGFTLSELIEIRQSRESAYSLFEALEEYDAPEGSAIGEKKAYFLAKLAEYRDIARTASADAMIRYIYNDLSVFSVICDSKQNLLRLYDYARKFESGAFKGLYNFISYINELIDNAATIKSGEFDPDTDTVKIMSIHKSKGLEFPVCFVSKCHKKLIRAKGGTPFAFRYGVGLGFRPADTTGLAKASSPIYDAVGIIRSDREIEEEMRILYVALTRARERLYITAEGNEKFCRELPGKAIFNARYACRKNVMSASSYIDWILSALMMPSADKTSFNLSTVNEKDIGITGGGVDNVENEIVPDKSEIKRIKDILRERFSFEYPYSAVSGIPAKLSVSKLYPGVLDEDGGEADLESANSLPDFAPAPSFMLDGASNATAADKGTATHVFLQFCDFDNVERKCVDEEIARLIEKRFIPKEYAGLIDRSNLRAFFASEFYTTMRGAKKLWREQRFNLFMPASEFTNDRELKKELEGEELLVQGVIDVFFENEKGEITLCDYKTDHLTKEELSDEALAVKKLSARHSEQLKYYSYAIERIVGKKPSHVLIYSLPLGKALEIAL